MKTPTLITALLLSAAPLLTACQTVSPGAIIAMANFDPLTVDPANLGFRVTVPDGVGLRSGDMMLRLSDETADGPILGTFPLTIGRKRLDSGQARYTGRLSSEHADAMRSVQARIQRSRKESGASGTGSFGIELVAACTASGKLPSPMPVTASIKASDGDFIPAIRSSDLPKDLSDASRDALQSRIRVCAN